MQKTVDHLAGQENRIDDLEVPLFDLSTVMTATNNFSEKNLIGAGGFGPVYKVTCTSFNGKLKVFLSFDASFPLIYLFSQNAVFMSNQYLI